MWGLRAPGVGTRTGSRAEPAEALWVARRSAATASRRGRAQGGAEARERNDGGRGTGALRERARPRCVGERGGLQWCWRQRRSTVAAAAAHGGARPGAASGATAWPTQSSSRRVCGPGRAWSARGTGHGVLDRKAEMGRRRADCTGARWTSAVSADEKKGRGEAEAEGLTAVCRGTWASRLGGDPCGGGRG